MKPSKFIPAFVRQLADKKPKPQAEIGVSADYSVLYDREEKRLDSITIEDLRKMRLNDGTVNAMYGLFTLPIKAAGRYFEATDGGDAEREFVEQAFTAAPQHGGMTYSFPLLISDILRALEDGFRLYEKVMTLNDKGQLVYKKIAPRDATSITLLRDEHGGFAGAKQRTWTGGKYINIEIPVERCFLFTYGKERNYLYGESAFRSAYTHYDRKHKLYYLQEIAAQASGLPPRKLKLPEGSSMESINSETLAAAEDAADNFGYQQRITLPPGWDIEEYKTNPMDLQPAIDHHDTLIARSTLMDFLALGSGSTGSYALSKDKTEMFMSALVGVMNEIENHINAYLIPPLIDYNFGSGKYPVFKFEELNKETRELMAESFTSLLSRDDVPGYVIEGIMKEMAQKLGIEIDEAAKVDTVDETKQKTEQVKEEAASTQNLSDSATELRLRKKAAAQVLAGKVDKSVDTATAAATAELQRLKEATAKKVETLLKGDDLAALRGLELPSFDAYRKLLENSMMDGYLLGKRSAADEGGIQIPKTPGKSRTYIVEQARSIVEKQQADLLFATKNEVTRALRTQTLSERSLGMLDILASLGLVWDGFIEKNASAGVDLALVGALNLGRSDSFATDTNIAVYEFTAIIDKRTTQLCRSLDRTVLTPEQYRATSLIPPLHFLCRSVWVAYYKDDSFIPELKPAPASARSQLLSESAEHTHAA